MFNFFQLNKYLMVLWNKIVVITASKFVDLMKSYEILCVGW